MDEEHEEQNYDRQRMIAAAQSSTIEDYLESLPYNLGDEAWDALVSDAAEAHLAGEVDLLEALTRDAPGRTRYQVQQFIEKVIVRLNLELPVTVAWVASLTAREPDGEPSHFVLNGFAAWARSDPERPFEAMEAIRTGLAPDHLLRPSLMTGLTVDRERIFEGAVEMVRTGTDKEREIAAGVLGSATDLSRDERNLIVTVLENDLRIAKGESIVPPLRALLRIALRAPVDNRLGSRTLRAVARQSDASVRETVATELMFELKKASPAFATQGMALLRDVERDEFGAIDAIDHIVVDALDGPSSGSAGELLDHILERGVATMEKLDSVTRALLTGKASTREETVRRWLTSPRLSHFDAVVDLCQGVGEKSPRFDIDFSGVSRSVAERTAKRCCAMMMVFPETVASIMASLLRTGPPEAFPAVEELLFDPLLVTYWDGPKKYLASLLPKAPRHMAAVIERAFARHDAYAKAVWAVTDVPELRPSEHHRFLNETKRRDEGRAIAKAAQKQSFLADLFPTSVMLYGDAAIFQMHVEPGKTVRQEAQLASHEFSHELPRLDVIDPFGSWYRRRNLLRGEDDA